MTREEKGNKGRKVVDGGSKKSSQVKHADRGKALLGIAPRRSAFAGALEYPQTAFLAKWIKVWRRRTFYEEAEQEFGRFSQQKSTTPKYRQNEDDVERYRPGADVAGVPGHCPEQNSEKTANSDQSRFQDFENQRWVLFFAVQKKRDLLVRSERLRKTGATRLERRKKMEK